jgi:hypothetical protein
MVGPHPDFRTLAFFRPKIRFRPFPLAEDGGMGHDRPGASATPLPAREPATDRQAAAGFSPYRAQYICTSTIACGA